MLYNTRTRRKQRFAPLEPGHVRMYSCGWRHRLVAGLVVEAHVAADERQRAMPRGQTAECLGRHRQPFERRLEVADHLRVFRRAE